MKIDEASMVQFPCARLAIPADHPDRKKYYSMSTAKRVRFFRVAEITLMSPGEYPCSLHRWSLMTAAMKVREQLEAVLRETNRQPARDICNHVGSSRVKQDDLRRNGETL